MSGTTSFEPRTGSVAGTIAETTKEELTRILEQARSAAPQLAASPPTERSAWLYAIAEALEQHVDELVEIADRETALGEQRLTGEVGRTAGQLRFYADVAAEGSYLDVTIDDATVTSPRLVRVNRPVGPVAVFGASNFPFAFGLLGNDTASAIAAGCPVIAKAHPAHVLLCERLAELATTALASARAPDGTFAMVAGYEAGASLAQADVVAAVAFTGSQSGGLALWRMANDRSTVIPVYAEMATVNPVIVTRGAASDMVTVAAGFVGSFTLGAGQFCTKPGLLFAPRGSRAAELVGHALLAAQPRPVMLTQGIANAFNGGLGELIDAGAEVVRSVPGADAGWSVNATVLRVPINSLRVGSRFLEECFGPVALIAEYDNVAELRAALLELPGSLAASVIVDDDDDPDSGEIIDQISGSVGRVIVNDYPTGVAFAWAQQHGGPWPATSNPTATSVGAAALRRFVRPIAFQSVPDNRLPAEAQASNPWRLPRRINSVLTPGDSSV
jgi:NADP-dependent aldehyde dehydrogenase